MAKTRSPDQLAFKVRPRPAQQLAAPLLIEMKPVITSGFPGQGVTAVDGPKGDDHQVAGLGQIAGAGALESGSPFKDQADLKSFVKVVGIGSGTVIGGSQFQLGQFRGDQKI